MKYSLEVYRTLGHWTLPLSIEIWGSDLGYKAWSKDFTIRFLCFSFDFIYNE